MLLIEPSWPAPVGVHAACSTREGGVSPAPFDSLNLGAHVGDSDAAVAENRRRFAAALAARPVFMAQVHGTAAVEIDAGTPDGVEADACWTGARGVACTIMVADCLPILLAATSGATVAAAHAGWRGLAGGVVEAAASALGADDAIAWLGPCIGPHEFEVGPEVCAAFLQHSREAQSCFRAHREDRYLADLPQLARQRLRALGITGVYGNDGSDDWCTVRNGSRFFSHRRDRLSGRFAAGIWLG